jgi:ABC-type transport system involved in cytochrome bd biosynthesis fused ATPase/permease subunit
VRRKAVEGEVGTERGTLTALGEARIAAIEESRAKVVEADLEEAGRLCRALGLGPLLERMPAGLHQMVGETGWQLSHGEKSRLYIARALLQGADLAILDESFAALDPPTLRHTFALVLQQARTVPVIAHP